MLSGGFQPVNINTVFLRLVNFNVSSSRLYLKIKINKAHIFLKIGERKSSQHMLYIYALG